MELRRVKEKGIKMNQEGLKRKELVRICEKGIRNVGRTEQNGIKND